MPFFLRAINRENWPEPEEHATVYDLDADALNDLKSQENTMSVWCAETEEDLKNAIVAYLASMDKWVEVEAVEFIAINSKDIESAGIEYNKVPNFTYIKEYETKHRDLIKLKYGSIEKLADLVIKSINNGRDYIVDKGQIREMFTEVVQVGKLCSEDIPKGKHKKLKRLLVEIEKEIEDSGK